MEKAAKKQAKVQTVPRVQTSNRTAKVRSTSAKPSRQPQRRNLKWNGFPYKVNEEEFLLLHLVLRVLDRLRSDRITDAFTSYTLEAQIANHLRKLK